MGAENTALSLMVKFSCGQVPPDRCCKWPQMYKLRKKAPHRRTVCWHREQFWGDFSGSSAPAWWARKGWKFPLKTGFKHTAPNILQATEIYCCLISSNYSLDACASKNLKPHTSRWAYCIRNCMITITLLVKIRQTFFIYMKWPK